MFWPLLKILNFVFSQISVLPHLTGYKKGQDYFAHTLTAANLIVVLLVDLNEFLSLM